MGGVFMALEAIKRIIEVEEMIGTKYAQVLVRAEALVPGAGREAIEPLMAEGTLFIEKTDLQTDRIAIEGSISCQAVYRQGDEITARALTAQTGMSHVIEIPGTEPDMLARVKGEVEHVEAKYENGHMVFLVSCGLKIQILKLSPEEVIQDVIGVDGLETSYRELCSVKLAAESEETALLKNVVPLPAALDARTSLMDWASVSIDSAEPDLGGIRIKGKLMVETLISSGVQGRPVILVRYPIELNQLVELPEWLTGNVFADADIRSIRTQVDQAEGEEDANLNIEAEVRLHVAANTQECSEALMDIYATEGKKLEVQKEKLSLCVSAERVSVSDTVRGTVLIGENAPGVGTVIAARVHPVIGEWRNENGRGRIEGILEATVLYMPGGSDRLSSARAELPFSLDVPVQLTEESWITMQVLNSEANALMSDRLEMRIQLNICCETRKRETYDIVSGIEEGETIQRKPGIIICWPESGEDDWTIGKRYSIPKESVPAVQTGRPIMIKI